MSSNERSNGATDLSSGKSLHFTEDDKFFCRLLSKDTSFDEPSFFVYYGIAPVAVPFRWESRPGTPKYVVPSDDLPPLTPPPSLSKPSKDARPLGEKTSSVARSKLLFARVLDVLHLRRPASIPRLPSFYSTFSSQSSSSSSSSSRHAAMLWWCGSTSRSTFSFVGCGCKEY